MEFGDLGLIIRLDEKNKAAIDVSSSFPCEVEEPLVADNPFLAAKTLICACKIDGSKPSS